MSVDQANTLLEAAGSRWRIQESGSGYEAYQYDKPDSNSMFHSDVEVLYNMAMRLG